MRTLRQRKDELIANIRNRKVQELQVYSEYRKILTQNGIKNEKLIAIHLDRMIKAGLSKAAVYSNLKFMNLFRSRLMEESIPLKHAEKIMEYVKFNLAEVNEDDDFIGDAALNYAELCKAVYDMQAAPFADTDLPDEVAKKFDLLPVELPAE